jgi:hypothetical protein
MPMKVVNAAAAMQSAAATNMAGPSPSVKALRAASMMVALSGVEDGTDEGDAHGAAHLAHRVVERGGDTLLLLGERRRDRGGGRAHGESDAGAEDQDAGNTDR